MNDALRWEQRAVKRILDVVLSAAALVVASPFMLVTAIAIKAYDGGPVLYSQKRLTTGGRVFKVYQVQKHDS